MGTGLCLQQRGAGAGGGRALATGPGRLSHDAVRRGHGWERPSMRVVGVHERGPSAPLCGRLGVRAA